MWRIVNLVTGDRTNAYASRELAREEALYLNAEVGVDLYDIERVD